MQRKPGFSFHLVPPQCVSVQILDGRFQRRNTNRGRSELRRRGRILPQSPHLLLPAPLELLDRFRDVSLRGERQNRESLLDLRFYVLDANLILKIFANW